MNLIGLILLPLLVQPAGPDHPQDVESYAVTRVESWLVISERRKPESLVEIFKISLDAPEDPGGAAIWNDRLVITLPKSAVLLICSLKEKELLSRQSLPDFPSPHGAAYDATGRLWILSANSLAEIQFTPDGHFNPIHHRGDFNDPRLLMIQPNGDFYVAENGPPAAVKILDPKLKLLETVPLKSPAVLLNRNAAGEPQCFLENGGTVTIERSVSGKHGTKPP